MNVTISVGIIKYHNNKYGLVLPTLKYPKERIIKLYIYSHCKNNITIIYSSTCLCIRLISQMSKHV